MTHHLTCNCGRVLHVRYKMAACPTCQTVYSVAVTSRPMTPNERVFAAAQLRGERLPEMEPNITESEKLK